MHQQILFKLRLPLAGMTIAVDTSFLHCDKATNFFIKEIFYRLANTHQKDRFLLFSDKPDDILNNAPKNITQITVTPTPANIFTYKWRYDFKIPAALKKHKADIFIGTNGICSLTTKLPQLLFIPNLNFLHYSVLYSKPALFIYKKFTPGFLKKSASVITFSEVVKQEIVSKYTISQQKITVISGAANNLFKPVSWPERENIKDHYAHGCEYFIFTGGFNPVKNLIGVLKAFSVFKKWQKTNMKLVIINSLPRYKDEAEKINSYKYKSELCFIENLSIEESARVIAGAYVLICPSLDKGFEPVVLEAMQCEVPVITSAGSSMAETAGNAALYTNSAEPEEIAAQMKRIFKDEQLRNNLITAGRERIKNYTWKETTSVLWEMIEKVVSK